MADTSTGRKSRQRAYKPKSKSGCITCKFRRVKCDERKPFCNRCERFGVNCDGYLTKMIEVHPNMNKPVLGGDSTVGRVLESQLPVDLIPGNMHLTDADYHYFKTFQDQTAVELSGYFENCIWNRSILQVCHLEEFARHGVLAMGALYMSMEPTQRSETPTLLTHSERSLGEQHRRIALLHYGKFLRSTRELARSKRHLQSRYTLLSCLLAVCFENYIGNQEHAMAAAQTGVDIFKEQLLAEKRTNRIVNDVLKDRSLDESDLVTTFARLESALILYNGSRRVPIIRRPLQPLQLEASCSFPTVPSRFESVREARMYWDLLTRHSIIWKDANLQRPMFSTLDFGELDPEARVRKIEQFAERTREEFMLCGKQKAQWLQAFLPVFKGSRAHPGSQEYLVASVLRIRYIASNLMTQVTQLPNQHSEVFFDQFLEEMTIIVDLAKDLLEIHPCTMSKRVVFSFDGSIIAGLFLVGSRCREVAVRKEALRLLVTYPRREGLLDGRASATIVTWLMNQEEKGMVDGFVPEAARLRVVKIDRKLTERRSVIRCSKLEDGCAERVELDEISLMW